jgi:hypothetical protein
MQRPFHQVDVCTTCHAWLEVGGMPANADGIVQQCTAGLIRLRAGAIWVGGANLTCISGRVGL